MSGADIFVFDGANVKFEVVHQPPGLKVEIEPGAFNRNARYRLTATPRPAARVKAMANDSIVLKTDHAGAKTITVPVRYRPGPFPAPKYHHPTFDPTAKMPGS